MWGNKKAINYIVLALGEFIVMVMFSTFFFFYHSTPEGYGTVPKEQWLPMAVSLNQGASSEFSNGVSHLQ